jgi:ParB family transcriptional regulator, chromosome partitioning protein
MLRKLINNNNNNNSNEEEKLLTLRNIPLTKINMRLDKYNYRSGSNFEEYDPDNENIKELAESIRYQGLINPITVIKSPYAISSITYDIIAGHRRFVACSLLRMEQIPCYILNSNTEAEQTYLIGLTENIQRNNLKPLEEAIGFKKYIELFDIKSIRQLEHKIGKSHSYIHSRLVLLELPDHIKQAINNKEISITVIDDISTAIINDKLRNELIEYVCNNKMSGEESRNLLRLVRKYEHEYLERNKEENGITPEKLKDMDTLSLEHILSIPSTIHISDDDDDNNDDDKVKQRDNLLLEFRSKHGHNHNPKIYSMKYRSKIEIVTSILKSISDFTRFDQKNRTYRGLNNTKIMYINLLSYAQLKDYIFYLLDKNMVTQLEIKSKETRYRNRNEYVITEKGLKFLKQSINLFKMIDMEEYKDIETQEYFNNKVSYSNNNNNHIIK